MNNENLRNNDEAEDIFAGIPSFVDSNDGKKEEENSNNVESNPSVSIFGGGEDIMHQNDSYSIPTVEELTSNENETVEYQEPVATYAENNTASEVIEPLEPVNNYTAPVEQYNYNNEVEVPSTNEVVDTTEYQEPVATYAENNAASEVIEPLEPVNDYTVPVEQYNYNQEVEVPPTNEVVDTTEYQEPLATYVEDNLTSEVVIPAETVETNDYTDPVEQYNYNNQVEEVPSTDEVVDNELNAVRLEENSSEDSAPFTIHDTNTVGHPDGKIKLNFDGSNSSEKEDLVQSEDIKISLRSNKSLMFVLLLGLILLLVVLLLPYILAL